MPKQEAIVSTALPQQVEKPIPTRMVNTRIGGARLNLNQPSTSVEATPADSGNPAESVKLSPQLSALARKEQAYLKREQALKEREKAIEEKLKEAEQYSQLKTKLNSKDYSEIEGLGANYEEYTEYLLNKQASEDPEKQKFQSLEDEIRALKKANEEKATQEYEETVAAYKKELSSLAESDPRFMKVKRFEEETSDGKKVTGVDVALQLILDSWEEDDIELSVEDALKQTEQEFEERRKRWVALEEQKEVVEEPKTLPPPKVVSKTLSQNMQPSGELKVPEKSLQHMSEAERYAEARRRALARMQQQKGS